MCRQPSGAGGQPAERKQPSGERKQPSGAGGQPAERNQTMQNQLMETAGTMTFSPLEFALLMVLLTAATGIIVGIAVRYLSANRFMSRRECEERHKNDCRLNQEMYNRIKELQQQHEKFQAGILDRNRILFRMLRGLVVYSDISAENKEKILNERGSTDE